jgi:hypothetical protein
MSVEGVIIRLAIMALLAMYLVSKHRQRVRNWVPRPEDPAFWSGRGIDASKLMPTIERVRDDHLAGRISPVRDFSYRRGLLELMKREATRLSFFQRRRCEEDAHPYASKSWFSPIRGHRR